MSTEYKFLTLNVTQNISPINIRERWKSLGSLGFPNYQISTQGRIINRKTLRFLEGSVKKDGYRRVNLSEKGIGKVFLIHRLVAMAFIPIADPDKFTIDHIDRNRDNNILSNLRWANAKDQAANRVATDRRGLRRPVYQFSLDGKFITKWDKPSDIEEIHISSVSKVFSVCKGNRKTAGGFIWKYADMDDLEGEVWKQIPYEEYGPILASNLGRIKRSNGKITTGYIHNGYWTIGLKILNTLILKSIRVHRLIIGSFYGRQDNLQVNHKDGNATNNNIDNLEYVTQQQNVVHAINIGLKPLNKVKTRSVISINEKGEERRYESIKSAAANIGINPSTISRACSGKQNTAGGFSWRYEKDVFSYLI